ncbi:putative galactonate dehydratase [Paenibacillus sp. 598K]|uniref:hypothetical protein n=1 Tax=Paenibacillus sp. 598K TaxID=1117987 RepID=UPI000FFAC7E1|nr:hypothetical protein [Paenibacillus sp. 598K]GBF77352.1 putative galactonate dehydratase [Paenibacillus sp. 598K]
MPIYRLLGGKVRVHVNLYANGWFAGAKQPEAFEEKANTELLRSTLGQGKIDQLSDSIPHRV